MAGGNAASNLILGKTGQKRPDIVLGHEAVGRVVEVGALVTDFKVGGCRFRPLRDAELADA